MEKRVQGASQLASRYSHFFTNHRILRKIINLVRLSLYSYPFGDVFNYTLWNMVLWRDLSRVLPIPPLIKHPENKHVATKEQANQMLIWLFWTSAWLICMRIQWLGMAYGLCLMAWHTWTFTNSASSNVVSGELESYLHQRIRITICILFFFVWTLVHYWNGHKSSVPYLQI